ncbi:hypothetical protein EmuJ_001132100 [Echinococcus multilocularis]|uniref:Uncharacterized protein n=1 Tax=Echinococcus multilocularis TaxID=6211 RepID=A0A068YNI4_ECHMU|nr:hypothetical protein EmuJ_001132100 [Echinococcus multilocularis]
MKAAFIKRSTTQGDTTVGISNVKNLLSQKWNPKKLDFSYYALELRERGMHDYILSLLLCTCRKGEPKFAGGSCIGEDSLLYMEGNLLSSSPANSDDDEDVLFDKIRDVFIPKFFRVDIVSAPNLNPPQIQSTGKENPNIQGCDCQIYEAGLAKIQKALPTGQQVISHHQTEVEGETVEEPKSIMGQL